MKLLLELGADVNAQDTLDLRTALMGAAHKGRSDVVRLLVDHGADLSLRDIGSRDTIHTLAGVTWQAVDYADGLVRAGARVADSRRRPYARFDLRDGSLPVVAKIVLGVWTTHGPQLNTTPEQWMLRVPSDKARSHWFKGKSYPFDSLVEMRKGEGLAAQATLEARTRHHAACQAAIASLAQVWADVQPDCCVIFGNDQRELLLPPLQPAFTVYHGDTFWNGPVPEERSANLPPGIRESEWANRPEQRTEYPGLPDLAKRLIGTGLDEGWDFAASAEWPEYEPEHHHAGTPHAFAYVLRRVMQDRAIPTLPIIANTFFPPNQPRPWRCFDLGRLVHRIVTEWDADLRVAIVGSGGMTHFVINEEFDRQLIDAIQGRDEPFLRAIDPSLMNDGTSELLNWISAAGCLFQTRLRGELIDYVPCYRTEAGSGTAQGFLAWT